MRTLLLGIALAGCASSSGQGPTATSAGGGNTRLICKEEAPTGSNISRPICRSVEQRADDRKGAEDMFRNQTTTPTMDPAAAPPPTAPPP